MPARSRGWTPSRPKRSCSRPRLRSRRPSTKKAQAEAQIVGIATATLATDYAELITEETVHVDGGYHILG